MTSRGSVWFAGRGGLSTPYVSGGQSLAFFAYGAESRRLHSAKAVMAETLSMVVKNVEAGAQIGVGVFAHGASNRLELPFDLIETMGVRSP